MSQCPPPQHINASAYATAAAAASAVGATAATVSDVVPIDLCDGNIPTKHYPGAAVLVT